MLVDPLNSKRPKERVSREGQWPKDGKNEQRIPLKLTCHVNIK